MKPAIDDYFRGMIKSLLDSHASTMGDENRAIAAMIVAQICGVREMCGCEATLRMLGDLPLGRFQSLLPPSEAIVDQTKNRGRWPDERR